MKSTDPDSRAAPVRWIRPVTDPSRSGQGRTGEPQDLDAFAGQVLRETRTRISGLAAIERELEDRIRVRWEETEAELRRKVAMTDEELLASRKRMEAELREARLRAEREGRGAGFRDGFARGREEGYRLGFEEGRREGQREGQREGREEEGKRLEGELSGAASALLDAAVELKEKREELLSNARRDLLQLAVEVARKLLKRELAVATDPVVRNVEKAIELIFRRGALTIQVHPDDAPVVDKALALEPRWVEGLDTIEVRACPEVGRGGCRIVSGTGTVDMTVETQLSLIEVALESAGEEPALRGATEIHPEGSLPGDAGASPSPLSTGGVTARGERGDGVIEVGEPVGGGPNGGGPLKGAVGGGGDRR